MIRRLPDAPSRDADGGIGRVAYFAGATPDEWREWRRTGVLTYSMRLKWWWRKLARELR